MTKSFLNYGELKKQALDESSTDLKAVNAVLGVTPAEEANLSEFFEEINIIQSEINTVNGLLSDLTMLHQESKSLHVPRLLRGAHDRMDADMALILRNAKIIKARLQLLDRSNITNQNLSKKFAEGSMVDRTRLSVTNGVRTKLRELMNGFQVLRDEIVADHRENLKRRYFNATGEEATEEVIEKMLSNGDKMEILSVAKGEMDLEMVERDKAVSDIRRSLVKLHQVFQDMAVMVETQEEKLNDIEVNLTYAKDYASGGTENLLAATAMKKRGDKNCFLLISASVVSVIVFLVCIIITQS
jgi:syntaxin 1B/2/3